MVDKLFREYLGNKKGENFITLVPHFTRIFLDLLQNDKAIGVRLLKTSGKMHLALSALSNSESLSDAL